MREKFVSRCSSHLCHFILDILFFLSPNEIKLSKIRYTSKLKNICTYHNNSLFFIMSLLLLVIIPQIHNHFRNVLLPFSLNKHVPNILVFNIIEFFRFIPKRRHGFKRSWRVDEISVGDATLRYVQVDVNDWNIGLVFHGFYRSVKLLILNAVDIRATGSIKILRLFFCVCRSCIHFYFIWSKIHDLGEAFFGFK